MTHTIQIQDQIFILHPCGGVFWKEKHILLISDVHLGKVAHFRKHGVAIPNEAIFANFKRLTDIVKFFNPEQIIFLGDLFHSKINNEWDLFADWVHSVAKEIVLVEGNHDIVDRKNYADLKIKCYPALQIDDFLLTHHPQESPGFFNFCGHIHPGIKLKDVGRQALQLSCFFQKPTQMTLPAFGEFTGNCYLKPTEDDKVYVITKDDVILISGN